MKYFYPLIISLVLFSCNTSTASDTEQVERTVKENRRGMPKLQTTYKEKLLASKKHYPFQRWREAYSNGLTQYTKDNCNKTKIVFDNLIDELIAMGETASKEEKLKSFKAAILNLNKLNEEIAGLIETGEREELCNLIDQITLASGLNPKEFADGEGIADMWREW